MKAWKILSSCLVVSALFGCNNYTAAPVCNDANAVAPQGLTGVYTLATQKEDFTVDAQEIKVGVDGKGHMKVAGLNKTGDEDESRLCSIGGYYVQESFNADTKGYEQSRLYVTGMGITTVPFFFDKAGLDADGIPNATFEVPDAAAKLVHRFSKFLTGEETTLGLMVDNANVYPEAVMRHSYAAPVGVTLFRK
jgi:hypothetical protein